MAVKTWAAGSTAGADGLWSTATNWTSDTVPVSGDTVTIDGTASSPPLTIDALGTFAGSITVTSAYAGTVSQNVAIPGGNFSLSGGTWNQNAAMTVGTFTINNAAANFQGGSANISCSGAGTFSAGTFRATSGTITFSGLGSNGNFTQSGSVSFNANGGTFNFTGNGTSTLTAPGCTLNLVTFNKGTSFVVAAGTTCPLGTNPSNAVASTFTINGTVTWTDLWDQHGSISITSTGTAIGSGTPSIDVNVSLTIDPAATVTALLPVTFSGNFTGTVTATAYTFGTCVISKTNPFTIAAGTTIPLGTNPTGTATQLTVNGTIQVSGVWNAGIATSITLGATGSISGTATLTLTNVNWTANAGATAPNLTIVYNVTSVSARTFAGGGTTYAGFRRTGSGSGSITITGTNTFGFFEDVLGSVAHTVIFPNVTTTVGYFRVRGSTGKLVTLARTGGSGTFTLAKSQTGKVCCDYISVSNSTVDVSPAWFAGGNSTDGGGNTNWLFQGCPRRKSCSFMKV